MDYENLIQKSVDRIEGRLIEKLSVKELADHAFFSKYYFQRLFHAVVGDSVMEYIKKRRLSLAGRELCETDATVLDIALKYGYGSHESFTRAFKAYHGITPTDCRKYSLFNSFDKINVSRGKEFMSNTMNISNAGDLLSKDVSTILSKNTNEILNILRDFIERMKQVGALGVQKAKENGLSGPCHSFQVLEKELSGLAERTQVTCNKIQAFADSSTDPFQPNNFFQVYSNTFEIIKAFDDMTFQTNFISFNAGLQAARESSPTIVEFSDIVGEYSSLAACVTLEKDKISSLFNELIEFVSKDIQTEAVNQVKKMIDVVKELSDKANAISAFTKAEALAETKAGKGFVVIADETKHISSELTYMHGQIIEYAENMAKSNSVYDIKQWTNEAEMKIISIDDFAFRVNILAFNAELEQANSPHSKGLHAATNQLLGFAADLHKGSYTCMEYLNEAKQLISFIDKEKKTEEKFFLIKNLDDIGFMGNILAFYLKVEAGKLSAITEHERNEAFNEVIEDANQFTSDVFRVKARLKEIFQSDQLAVSTTDFKNSMREELAGLSKKAFQIYEKTINKSLALGEMGGGFVYLANEYKRFTDRILGIADI